MVQESYDLHGSGAKAVQSKAERYGSLLQGEFAAPQFVRMVLNRVLGVMYRMELEVEVQLLINALQPNDNETLLQSEHQERVMA